eukprot:scaffold174650_cov22-Tisochrysis_lutea.AAC.1
MQCTYTHPAPMNSTCAELHPDPTRAHEFSTIFFCIAHSPAHSPAHTHSPCSTPQRERCCHPPEPGHPAHAMQVRMRAAGRKEAE